MSSGPNEVKLTQERYNQLLDAVDKVNKHERTIERLLLVVSALNDKITKLEIGNSAMTSDFYKEMFKNGRRSS